MKDLNQMLMGAIYGDDDYEPDEWDRMEPAMTPEEATEAYRRQAAKHERLARATQSGTLGFIPPYMASMSLPHRESAERATYKRRVPPDLTGSSWATMTLRCNPEFGVPHGVIPRLLIAHVTSYVAQRKKRRVPLGKSRRECASIIGAALDGDTLKRIDRGINALTHSTWDFDMKVHYTCPDTGRKSRLDVHRTFQLAQGDSVGFPGKNVRQRNLYECYVDVNEELFQSMTASAPNRRPFYLDVYRELQDSPLKMDLYLWYTTAASMGPPYRDYKIRDLMGMFGTFRDPSSTKAVSAFKADLLKHTHYIQQNVYPVRVESPPYSKILRVYKPDRPHVDPRHASFFHKNAKIEETYTTPDVH